MEYEPIREPSAPPNEQEDGLLHGRDMNEFPDLSTRVVQVLPTLYLRTSWKLLRNCDVLGFLACWLTLNLVMYGAEFGIMSAMGHDSFREDAEDTADVALVKSDIPLLIVLILLSLIRSAVNTLMYVGFTKGLFRMLSHPEYAAPPVNSWLVGFTSRYRWRAIVLTIFETILVTLGFLLFYIPGLYLTFAFTFTTCILVEFPDMPYKDIFRNSAHIVHQDVCGFLLFYLFCFAFVIAGLFFFVVGAIPAILLVTIMVPVAYREIVGLREPPSHQLHSV